MMRLTTLAPGPLLRAAPVMQRIGARKAPFQPPR
jgi:hypothetical protein